MGQMPMRAIYHRLMQACGALAALSIGAVALLVTFDVVARNLGLANLPWVVEVSEYSLPLATFLAAPWLLYRNEHVRLDMVLTALPRRAARLLDRLADLVGIAVSLVFVWYGVRVIADSRALGSMVFKTLVFPEWWLFVPVPLCFALLAVEFLRRMLGANGLAPSRQGTA
jgi:TRAP-type C4-dicarboxylate transport system permease small subunit